MVLPKQGSLLRIFVNEADQHDGLPTYEWLIKEARAQGLAGVTVLRGMQGFGRHSRVHTAKVLRLSTDLPIVIEIVDSREKIDMFLPAIEDAVPEGLATIEDVEVHFYRSRKADD